MLEVNNLKTHFKTHDGVVKAVDGVSFSLEPGETMGIVGESGSGKSVTALSIMQLNPKPPAEYPEGEIIFEDQNLLETSDKRMQAIRGNDIAMIFQDPMTSLNPVFTVGNQIREAIRIHQNLSKGEAQEKTIQVLRDVGIANPERRAKEYPHQFSGGMRQRAMIAMGLSCNPKVLIADEPTTALDVTIQAQILELMVELQEKYGTAIIMITHDLGVVSQLADKVMVMYAGRAVEQATTDEVFYDPLMPYSWSLLRSLPRLDTAGEVRLLPIEGTQPRASSPSKRSRRTRAAWTKSWGSRRDREDERRPGNQRPFRRVSAGDQEFEDALPNKGWRVTAHGRAREGRGRRRPLRAPRGDARARGGVGVRQEHARPPHSAPSGTDGGRGNLRRRGHTGLRPQADARRAQEHADRLPGPLCKPEPSHDRRQHRLRAAQDPRRRRWHRRRAQAAGAGTSRAGRPQPRALQPLPARVLGRTKAEDRGGKGHRSQPAPDHLRRARLGFGRLDPGAGHQLAGGHPAGVRSHLRLHSPRPLRGQTHLGQGRRDVPRQDRGDRRQGNSLRRAAPPLHRLAALCHPRPRPAKGARAPARGPLRRRTFSRAPSRGLLFPHPLSSRPELLHRPRARTRTAGERGPKGRLLLPRARGPTHRGARNKHSVPR